MLSVIAGVFGASVLFPGHFDWVYMVISQLGSRNHNPAGAVWLSASLLGAMCLPWPVTGALGRGAAREGAARDAVRRWCHSGAVPGDASFRPQVESAPGNGYSPVASFRTTILRRTLSRILTEYGPVAVVVYLVIFTGVLAACWALISLGWRPTGIGANVGAFTAAYLATKVTQPFRIAATVAVTPFVARALGRSRGAEPLKEAEATPGDQKVGVAERDLT